MKLLGLIKNFLYLSISELGSGSHAQSPRIKCLKSESGESEKSNRWSSEWENYKLFTSLSYTHLSSSNNLPLSLSLQSSLFLTWAGTPILFKVAATMRTDILSPYDTRASFVRGVSSPIYLMPNRKGENYVSKYVEKNEEEEKYKHHITYFIPPPPPLSSYVNIDISLISNNDTTYPH